MLDKIWPLFCHYLNKLFLKYLIKDRKHAQDRTKKWRKQARRSVIKSKVVISSSDLLFNVLSLNFVNKKN